MSRFLALFMLLLPSSCEPSPAGQPSGGRGGAPASAGAKGAGVQEGQDVKEAQAYSPNINCTTQVIQTIHIFTGVRVFLYTH